SADRKTAAIVGKEFDVSLWDVESGKKLHDLLPPTADNRALFGGIFKFILRATGVAFSPDGELLVVNTHNVVRQWDVASGKEVGPRTGHVGPVSAVAISADGKTVLSRGADHTYRRWDAVSGAEQRVERLPERGYHGKFAADGRTLVVGS